MLMTVKEYAARVAVSPSTIQRRLNKGELKGRRFGRVWYIELNEGENPSFDNSLLAQETAAGDLAALDSQSTPALKEVIGFSSKALNSYLLISDRLIEEKERAFAEKIAQLNDEKQRVLELQAYVKMLESLLAERLQQPDRQSVRASAASSAEPFTFDPTGVMHV